MMQTFDQFLHDLRVNGYDRDFITHNMPLLRQQYEQGVVPAPMPEPPGKGFDRYSEV